MEEEYAISNFLSQVDLLNPNHRKVEWLLDKNSNESAPFYISDSFESFKEKNIFIIDKKNSKSDTWEGKIFNSIDECENLNNWPLVIDELIEDVAKIVFYKIPASSDSINTAIVKTDKGYKIRYFGFDFTSKISSLDNIPNKNNTLSFSESFFEVEKAIKVFHAVIENALFSEYDETFSLKSRAYTLLDNLSKEYAPKILIKVEQLDSAKKQMNNLPKITSNVKESASTKKMQKITKPGQQVSIYEIVAISFIITSLFIGLYMGTQNKS